MKMSNGVFFYIAALLQLSISISETVYLGRNYTKKVRQGFRYRKL